MRRWRMSGPEYLFTILAATFTVGLLSYPSILVGGAGRSWPLPVLIDLGLTFVGLWASLRLSLTFPGRTLIEYGPRIIGRWASGAVILAYIALHGYFGFTVTERLVQSLHPFVLFYTPSPVISAILVLVAYYIAANGLKGLARTCVVIIPLAYLLGLAAIALAYARVEVINLTPSLTVSIGSILKTSYQSYGTFTGFHHLLLLAAFVDQPLRRLRLAYHAFWITVVLLLVYTLSVIGTLGVDTPRHILWPGLVMMQTVRFPGVFIERLGFLMIVARAAQVALYVALQLWSLTFALMQLFNLPRATFRPLIALGALAFFSSSFFTGDAERLGSQLENVVGPMGLVGAVVMPALLLAIARLRGFVPSPTPPVATSSAPAEGGAAASAAPPSPPAGGRTAPTGGAPPAAGKGASRRTSRRAARTARATPGRGSARR